MQPCCYLKWELTKKDRSHTYQSETTLCTYERGQRYLVFDQTGYAVFDHKNLTIEKDPQCLNWKHLSPKSKSHIIDILGDDLREIPNDSLLCTYYLYETTLLAGSPILLHGHFMPNDSFTYIVPNNALQHFRKQCLPLWKSASYLKKVTEEQLAVTCQRMFAKAVSESKEQEIEKVSMAPQGPRHERLVGQIQHRDETPLHVVNTFQAQFLQRRHHLQNFLLLALAILALLLALIMLKNPRWPIWREIIYLMH